MPPSRNSAQTSERILDAAIRVLAQRGHAGLTMQGVADEAAVDKALLHYYFTSKTGLLAAVVEHLGERLLSGVERAVAELDQPDAVIEIGFGKLWSHVTSEPELHAVWLSLYAAAITTPALAGEVSAVRERYRAMVGARLDAMVAAGWRSRLGHAATVTLVLASIDGLMTALLEDGHAPGLEEAITAVDQMIGGVMVRATA